MRNEMDFLCSNLEWDDFLNKLLEKGGVDYLRELIIATRYNMRYIQALGDYNSVTKSKEISILFHLQSFNIREDGMWHIKFNAKESKKMSRIKLDIKDLILGLLMSNDSNDFFKIIHKEILCSPIYK